MTDTRAIAIDGLRRQAADLGMAMDAYRELMAKPVWYSHDVADTLREANRHLPAEARFDGLYDAFLLMGFGQQVDPGIRSSLVEQFEATDAHYRHLQLQLRLLDA